MVVGTYIDNEGTCDEEAVGVGKGFVLFRDETWLGVVGTCNEELIRVGTGMRHV